MRFRLPRRMFRSPILSTVRARVVALGLVAAIPAVGMAGIIAGQDYRSRERLAIEQVDRLQGQAIVRIEAAADELHASLSAISKLLSHEKDCAEILKDGVAASAGTMLALALFDANGNRVCRGGVRSDLEDAAAGQSGWFRRAPAGASPALHMAAQGATTVAAIPTEGGGVLAAWLPRAWFATVGRSASTASQAAIWLLDQDGTFIAANGSAGDALPPVATMLALQASADVTLLGRSAGGVHFAYASTRLANGWQVVGAYRSTREHLKALNVLYIRLADLAALLLLGLAATVLGAEIAFGDPLRRLRAAVINWQKGAPFDPYGLQYAPTELLDLARSFAQATVSLREREAELARARERQDLLVLEVHHRVKNNLQIIASLLNLQASRIRVPEARAEFQAARDRVRALATLHRHLYSEGELHTINMRSFLVELCGQLFQAMGETEGNRISLTIEAPELRMSPDQAVPLALIVTEAVTNAVKYAFPGGRRGHVTVALSEHDGVLDLVISDDGVGIPAGRTETETGTRDGIGLQLIRGFARQLGASLEIGEAQGTRYAVRLSLHPQPIDPGCVPDIRNDVPG
jgi:two-component sensor histidine kinase